MSDDMTLDEKVNAIHAAAVRLVRDLVATAEGMIMRAGTPAEVARAKADHLVVRYIAAVVTGEYNHEAAS